MSDLKGKILKAAFITRDSKLIDIRILVFNPKANANINYDDLAKSFIENNAHDYSGKASIYTIYQDLIFFNDFEDGKIKINGAVSPATTKNSGGRTNGCIAWYLITTYYYSDGSTSQTSEYLGTTCDCEQNTTRSSSTMCGGGDGGGDGGSGLPNNPQQGDTYVVNLPNGISRLLEYHCYDYACFWETILTTLPAVVVTANRQDYYFLPINPFPNMFILGPDNLLYNYNANWMEWTGTLNVENKVTTPCLRNQVEAIRSNNVASDIQGIFNDVFDNDAGNNMYTFTESSNPSYPARTFLESTNPLQLRTDLNTSLLSTASLEYTTIVIYHEIVHAILYNNGTQASLHHPTILADYIDELAQSAIPLFPNLPIQDARAIALFGLGSVANSNPAVYDQVAAQYGLTREQISETGTSYRRDNVQGNIKKGMPCN